MFSKLKYFNIIVLVFIYACSRQTENINENEILSPSIPSNLQIYYAGNGRITFDWDKSPESYIAGYNIYRSINDTSTFYKIGFTINAYFVDDSLNYDNSYFYKITAIDNTGKESGFSTTISGKPVNLSPPYIPSNLEINARNWIGIKSVYLKWSPNNEGDILCYKIFRSQSSSFAPDSSTYIGKTGTNFFLDTTDLQFYKNYYYKIIAVDKGTLASGPSDEVSDMIFEIPEVISPKDSINTINFSEFVFKSIGSPASYKIIVQDNPYFGEIWSNEFFSPKVNDTIRVNFSYYYIEPNTTYYWRIVTYSGNNEPNSISRLYNFTLRTQY